MRRFAISWMALTLTGSQFWVGLVTGLPGLTIALFAPLAGVAVDHYNRRNLLIGVRTAFVVFALPLGILAVTGALEPWHLIVVTLAVGTVRALSMPALRAFLVGRDRLLSANALTGSSSSAGELIGPVVMGVAVKALGVASGLFMTAAAFGTCALLLFRVKPRPPTEVSRGPALGQLHVQRSNGFVPAGIHPGRGVGVAVRKRGRDRHGSDRQYASRVGDVCDVAGNAADMSWGYGVQFSVTSWYGVSGFLRIADGTSVCTSGRFQAA